MFTGPHLRAEWVALIPVLDLALRQQMSAKGFKVKKPYEANEASYEASYDTTQGHTDQRPVKHTL